MSAKGEQVKAVYSKFLEIAPNFGDHAERPRRMPEGWQPPANSEAWAVAYKFVVGKRPAKRRTRKRKV